MIKFRIILLAVSTLVMIGTSCKEDEPELPTNQPPGPFTVSIEIIGNTANLSWTEAIDPDGDSVTYQVFLEGDQIETDLKTTEFVIRALDYESNYSGKVVAEDDQGAIIESAFNFAIGELRAPEIKWDVRIPIIYGIIALSNHTDGGFILAVDSTLFKFDPEGKVVWEKTYNGRIAGRESLIQTADGGFALTGLTWHPEEGWNYWLAVVDDSGDLLWEKNYDGNPDAYRHPDGAYSLQQTSDGGFILAGASQGLDRPPWELIGPIEETRAYLVIKVDSEGNQQWHRRMEATKLGSYSILGGINIARSVALTSDGGYVIGGSVEPYADNEHLRRVYWIIKLNGSGEDVWDVFVRTGTEESALQNSFRAMSVTSDGGFIIAGKIDDLAESQELSGCNGDFQIMKLDDLGNKLWEKRLGSPYTEEVNCNHGSEGPSSVYETSDGGYLVAGTAAASGGDVANNNGRRDYWLVKLNQSGDLEWEKNLGGSEDDFGAAGIQTKDGGYLVAGSSASSDGDVSASGDGKWVVKLK